jgi:transcriptional regulator with XRE-family HTH domain
MAVYSLVKGQVLATSHRDRIARRIKQIRRALGPWPGKSLPRHELGRRLGVDESTIKKWETAEVTPGTENVRRLAEVAGCDISWIVAGEGRPPEGVKTGLGGAARAQSVAEPSPHLPYRRDTRSTGDAGNLPRADAQQESLTPAAARSSMEGPATATRTPPSVQDIADRAAELVGQLAQRLYDKDPRLLREWLIRLAVDTPPELVPEVDALIDLARKARWRWIKDDDAREARGPRGPNDDSPERT